MYELTRQQAEDHFKNDDAAVDENGQNEIGKRRRLIIVMMIAAHFINLSEVVSSIWPLFWLCLPEEPSGTLSHATSIPLYVLPP